MGPTRPRSAPAKHRYPPHPLAWRRTPSDPTINRVLTCIDGDTLEAAIGAYLAHRHQAATTTDGTDTADPPSPRLPAIAVDGKALKGSARLDPGGGQSGLGLPPDVDMNADDKFNLDISSVRIFTGRAMTEQFIAEGRMDGSDLNGTEYFTFEDGQVVPTEHLTEVNMVRAVDDIEGIITDAEGSEIWQEFVSYRDEF